MAFELHRIPGIPGIAASAIRVGDIVTRVGGDTQRSFKPIGSGLAVDPPQGVAAATAAQGGAVTVYDDGHIVPLVAGASVGAGANVGVINTAATTSQVGPVVGASGVTVWRVGVSETAAAAGETLSVYVSTRQISNLQ